MACIAVAATSCGTSLLPVPAPLSPTSAVHERFLLFFPSEAGTLTDEANAIVAGAAAQAKTAPPELVVVYGFADQRGDASMNARLSRDRARAVADALIEAGIPRQAIMTRGLGETVTIAPASDLNPEGRRAEIIFVR